MRTVAGFRRGGRDGLVLEMANGSERVREVGGSIADPSYSLEV